MKSEEEIRQYLEKIKKHYKDAHKSEQKYLETIGKATINALHWVLDLPPYNFNKE